MYYFPNKTVNYLQLFSVTYILESPKAPIEMISI